jgi:hypothetical protein
MYSDLDEKILLMNNFFLIKKKTKSFKEYFKLNNLFDQLLLNFQYLCNFLVFELES